MNPISIRNHSDMPPHRIRLCGFWTPTPLDGGRTRLSRAFGRPRSLDPNERAWLVCDSVSCPATVFLNGVSLGSVETGRPFAFDVMDQLAVRNEVAVELAVGSNAELGEVALEIRRV